VRWWWVWRPSTSTGQLIRNIGSTLVTRVAVMFIALLSSVLLARLLGPEGRGVFALLLLIPSPVTSLGLLGFEQANAVYAGLEPRGRRTLIWQSAAVAAGVGTVLTATAVAYFLSGAPGFEALAAAPPALVLLLLLATIPARLVVEHWGAIVRGMNRIQILNLFEIGGKLAPFLGVVVLVWALDLGGVRRGGRREHRREPSARAANWYRCCGDRIVCFVLDSFRHPDRV
jgi:O-antigen/teichoic acid export membrane protein